MSASDDVMKLRLKNSLTNGGCEDNDEFVTSKEKQVGWYICGPTVYDASHLGHARNYISFDIIRRVLEDFYGYNVFYVMNITDIDDKIIQRAIENRDHTCDSWDIQNAYLELSRHFEREFFDDMSTLGNRPPTVVTRVSDYMDEIKQYIAKIIENGFAYVVDGNVYFDSTAFQEAGFKMGKISGHDHENHSHHHDDMSSGSDKKRVEDFVLWKKAKQGEPRWESDWGDGRPGWHIECSAMASTLLGDNVDINCGGWDLRFPHHDNQLSQSEAYFGCKQWVNYFLHTGHLHIDGMKMSKSLKNFISIKSCLKIYRPIHIRLLFLYNLWYHPMQIDMVGDEDHRNVVIIDHVSIDGIDITEKMIHEYLSKDRSSFFIPHGTSFSTSSSSSTLFIRFSEDGIKSMQTWQLDENGTLHEDINIRAGHIVQLDMMVHEERFFADFFLKISAYRSATYHEKWGDLETTLHTYLQNTQHTVISAMNNSINTYDVMNALKQLAKHTITYMNNQNMPVLRLLDEVSRFVFVSILFLFCFYFVLTILSLDILRKYFVFLDLFQIMIMDLNGHLHLHITSHIQSVCYSIHYQTFVMLFEKKHV